MTIDKEKAAEEKARLLELEKQSLSQKYKEKGFQKMTIQEYRALQTKKNRRFSVNAPAHVKFMAGTPFIIIFCFGLFFIPYILYQVVIAKDPSKEVKPQGSYDALFIEEPAEK